MLTPRVVSSCTFLASRDAIGNRTRQFLRLLSLFFVLKPFLHELSCLGYIVSRPDVDRGHPLLSFTCTDYACRLSLLSCLREALWQLLKPSFLCRDLRDAAFGRHSP